VIEDALDVTRIENQKFELFMEEFDLKSTLEDVCDIM